MSNSANETSLDLLDTVPGIMNVIRGEMRAHLAADLSVPQFRTLNYLNRQPGVSLSDVAEHVGTTLPSASVLIDGLVARGLVVRLPDEVDRRKVTLWLTELGRLTRESARRERRPRWPSGWRRSRTTSARPSARRSVCCVLYLSRR